MSYPVLIGSRALFEYGLVPNFKDVDLIVDESMAKDLCFQCNEKKSGLLFFLMKDCGYDPVDLHLIKDASDRIIFQECNKLFAENKSQCRLIDLKFCKALLPPLEILYVIIKSHIHRIINVAYIQSQNNNVWYEHVKKYKLIRDTLGYEKLDTILYTSYLSDWRPLSEDGSLEDMMRKIYQLRFTETTKRVGDTVISMNKSEKEFFDDNVKRYVDHDKLHEAVAMEFRSVATPIFLNYQKGKDSVSLDLETFLKSNPSERIEMLREEIVVLFLERKLVPELMMWQEKRGTYELDSNRKSSELFDVVANFITNLCGQGDAWLRRFCLDHAHLLVDDKFYDIEKIIKIAYSVTNIEQIVELTFEKDKVDLFEFARLHATENNEIFEQYCDDIYKLFDGLTDNESDEASRDSRKNSVYDDEYDFFGSESKFTIGVLPVDQISKWQPGFVKVNLCQNMPPAINSVINHFVGSEKNKKSVIGEIHYNSFTIYSLESNVGIYCLGSDLSIFSLCIDSDNYNRRVKFSGICININTKQTESFDLTSQNEFRKEYYHSKGCEFTDFTTERYLSDFGSCPDYVKTITSALAMKILPSYRSNYY